MAKKSGLAFHCHHNTLVEWVTSYDERVEYIKRDKPKEEVELRLRLFKLIPKDRIPADLLKARDAYVKAWDAYDKATATAREAYRKAIATAREAYNKAWGKHKDYFTTLHKELCPDCPWDGETIFPDKEE